MTTRTRLALSLPFVLALLALPCLALASGDIVIQATGSSQGLIQGESVVLGHQNWIDVFSFSHGVSVPTGPDGTPSGPAQTSPLTIMTRFDKSTVKLFTAQSTQENFSNFKMEWVQGGTPNVLIRYDLQNAHVIDAQESGSAGGDVTPTVSLSFSYSRITITDVVQGTSVSYDWVPASAAPAQQLAKGILLPPSPNPTSGQTEFRFSLPVASNADLTLFDVRGRLVRELHHGWTAAEPTVAVWDGTDDRGMEVAQGMYVARLTYPGMEVTQRIAIMR